MGWQEGVGVVEDQFFADSSVKNSSELKYFSWEQGRVVGGNNPPIHPLPDFVSCAFEY